MTVNFDLESDIKKLIECDALELYKSKDDASVIYIPYMMNDALECYLKFTKCTITGSWDKEYGSPVDCDFTSENGRNALILNQGVDNVVIVWYESVEKYVDLYQYHRIAHKWVKGNEKWRRLVYITGTLYDKLNFMGVEYCNKEELALVPLMGFAPFRYFTPIHENLDDYYRDTRESIAVMMDFAEKTGNESLKNLIAKYTVDFSAGKLSKFKIMNYARKLSKDTMLYQYIDSLIETASAQYNERKYDVLDVARLNYLKEQAAQKLLDEGYSGIYPKFSKNKKEIILYEEHPYVMQEFEYTTYDFRVNEIEL